MMWEKIRYFNNEHSMNYNKNSEAVTAKMFVWSTTGCFLISVAKN